MRRLVLALALIAATAAFPLSPRAQSDEVSEKEAAVRELMQAVQAEQLMDQISAHLIPRMTDLFVSANPQFPDKVKTIVREEFNTLAIKMTPIMTKYFVAIWGNYFDIDEIQELIAFYETPLGQKLVRLQPEIMQRSMEDGAKVGQVFGRRAAERIIDRLRQENLKVPDQL